MCYSPPNGSCFFSFVLGAQPDSNLAIELETLNGSESSSQRGSVVVYKALGVGKGFAGSSGKGKPTSSEHFYW